MLDTSFGKLARLQMLTIEDLCAGKKPAMPPEDPAAFKRAAREEEKTKAALANSSHCLIGRVQWVGPMSAFGGKADVIADPSACLLIARSGHSAFHPTSNYRLLSTQLACKKVKSQIF